MEEDSKSQVLNEDQLSLLITEANAGNIDSIMLLVKYYTNIGDSANIEKYLKMGVDQGDALALTLLIGYYNLHNNHTEVIKYGLILYNHGGTGVAGMLGIAYR